MLRIDAAHTFFPFTVMCVYSVLFMRFAWEVRGG